MRDRSKALAVGTRVEVKTGHIRGIPPGPAVVVGTALDGRGQRSHDLEYPDGLRVSQVYGGYDILD